MCMMCMILSGPNCWAVAFFEYSSTDVTLLPSLFVSNLSEHVALQSKYLPLMAECRLRPPKTSEEEANCVDSAIPR